MFKSLDAQRLLALFAAGWLVFSSPLQRLWSGSALGLFLAWALLIAVLAFLMERPER
ncbi:MAG: hypothetical protein JNJ71_07095 [Rubrivivax sp.]|nr:hypothetical protein [Rubrivivax sp.]